MLRKLLSSLLALSVCVTLGAQARIYTPKARLADFYSLTTVMVLPGDPFVDALMLEEAASRWRVSPYEFCTQEEYSTLCKDASLYFLRVLYRDSDPGMAFLCLSKGGRTDKTTALDSFFDVVMLPFDHDDFSSGRAATYFGALVDFVQLYTEDARISDSNSLLGLSFYNKNLLGRLKAPLYIASGDIMTDVSVPSGVVVKSQDSVDAIFEEEEQQDVLVGVVFCSKYPGRKAKSHQMVISSLTHELLFYSVHPYETYSQKGFSARDMKTLSKYLENADR